MKTETYMVVDPRHDRVRARARRLDREVRHERRVGLLLDGQFVLFPFDRAQPFGALRLDQRLAEGGFTNDQRAVAKRRIDELLGSDILEEKSYQAY